MINEQAWLMYIRGAHSAHFYQLDGSSIPGRDWSVSLKRNEIIYSVLVRAYFSKNLTRRAREDVEYQGQTVLGFISDLLAHGWTPDQRSELVITIQNPIDEKESEPDKSWWRFW